MRQAREYVRELRKFILGAQGSEAERQRQLLDELHVKRLEARYAAAEQRHRRRQRSPKNLRLDQAGAQSAS